MDDFLAQFQIPMPNHLKIDVDGIELDVLRGAQRALANPALRSVLIEVEEGGEGAELISQFFVRMGLELHSKHKYAHGGESGPFSRVHNYIFHRATVSAESNGRIATEATTTSLENTNVGTS